MNSSRRRRRRASDEALSAPGLSNAEREALQEKLARNQEEIVKRLKDLRNALMEDRKTFGRAVNRVQKEEALSKQDKKALYKLSERLEGALRAASQRLAESFLDDPRPLPLGFFPEESREEGPIAPELVETEISRKRFSSTPNDARFDNTRGVGFGTALPHQPKSDPGWDKWRLYPFEEHPDVVNPSLFEQSAFRSNRYVGRGASSSTFMMYNAFKQCNAESFYNINIGDAMVGTIMFMTFDSGHSMTDSMGGLTAYMDYEGEEDLRRGRDRLDEFYLQYGSIDMRMLRSHTETHKGVKQAIDAAFTRTLDWFEEIHNECVAQDRGAENDR
jgi:hypothetical protein